MSKDNENVVLIAAGGTGGHLLPAQQIAQLLQNSQHKVIFAASKLSESQAFQKNNFSYKDIIACPVSKNIFKMFVFIFFGFVQSIGFILKVRPKLILGFGSYHTFPLMLAAAFLNKKIILFEYNCKMGMVNRFFASKAKYVATQFALNLKNEVLVSPLPWSERFQIKDKILARKELKLDINKKTVLIFGGSQGAKTLNAAFLEILDNLKMKWDFQVIHLIGMNENIEFFKEIYQNKNILTYVKAFEKDMPTVFSAADFAICRSGAGTISELIFFEVPALLVPYPWAKENHQAENARFYQSVVCGGERLLQKDITSEKFGGLIADFFDSGKLSCMKNNIQNYKLAANGQNRPHLLDLILQGA